MEHKDAIVALETREIGKTLKESAGSVQEAIDTCCFSNPKEEDYTVKPSTQNYLIRNCSPTEERWVFVGLSMLVISLQPFHFGR